MVLKFNTFNASTIKWMYVLFFEMIRCHHLFDYIFIISDRWSCKEQPLTIKEGELILIRIRNKVDESEKRHPWIGEVTKRTLTSVHFEWMVKTQDGLWKCGLVNPARDRTAMINILANLNTTAAKKCQTNYMQNYVHYQVYPNNRFMYRAMTP